MGLAVGLLDQLIPEVPLDYDRLLEYAEVIDHIVAAAMHLADTDPAGAARRLASCGINQSVRADFN